MYSTYEETVARELSGWVSAAHLVSVSVAGAAGLSTKYLRPSMKESAPPMELPHPHLALEVCEWLCFSRFPTDLFQI